MKRASRAYSIPLIVNCHQADLRELPLTVETFGTKFDVILIDPPWEEYVRRAPGDTKVSEAWPWQDIQVECPPPGGALQETCWSRMPVVIFLFGVIFPAVGREMVVG